MAKLKCFSDRYCEVVDFVRMWNNILFAIGFDGNKLWTMCSLFVIAVPKAYCN